MAVGSPLHPEIANFFMKDSENTAFKKATHKLLCRFQYVCETFSSGPIDQS
jgi:hypothetical protein